MRVCLIQAQDNRMMTFPRVIPYSLHVLKAVTPKEHEVVIVDDYRKGKLPECDIYGLSVLQSNYQFCLEIGKRLLSEGKTVIMGGPETNFKAEEMLEYCSSVVTGEGEDKWPQILDDAEKGILKSRYDCGLSDIKKFPIIDRSELSFWQMNNIVLTTRGCKYKCAFCNASDYVGRKIRTRDVEDVLKELKQISETKNLFGKIVVFADNNIVSNIHFAKELFRGMIGMNLQWFSQCAIDLALDDELLDLAEKSGCAGIFIGYESIEKDTLKVIKKQCAEMDYLSLTKKIKSKGIHIMGSFIFGFDTDSKDVFKKAGDFCLEGGIDLTEFNIWVPFPNTEIYEQMGDRVKGKTFIPRNMTYAELKKHAIETHDRFFSLKNIFFRTAKVYSKKYRWKGVLLYFILSIITKYNFKKYLKSFTYSPKQK